MPSNYRDHWKDNWEYIELMNFLIEKTKDVESPMSINGLAREFKEKSGCFQEVYCIIARIKSLRERVADLDTIDTETKVKMIFALSASIDKNFLNELRKDADVEIDEKNRITKYRAKDGSIELEEQKQLQNMGKSYRDMWKNDPEYIELMKFLIERTKDVESPMSINGLAREFKEKRKCSQEFHCLIARIKSLRGRVAESATIDTATKVKMLFALSAPVDENLLKGLRKDADVEIDENNRITKYKAKDGSLELNGDHSPSAKMKDGWKHKRMEIQKCYILKTPGSMKRSAPEVPNFVKFARIGVVKSEDPASNPVIRQPKLEVTTTIKTEPGKAEEAPILKNGGAPRALGAPGAAIPQGASSDAYTPQIKLLEAIHSLILTLEMPSLSPLQEKIDKKIRESSSNAMIRNDEMSLAMTMLFEKITGNSMPIQSESVKSASLKEFLCYLKAAIFNSKLKGLQGLLEKIRGRIEELTSEDKNIPAEKVASALQATLDVIGL